MKRPFLKIIVDNASRAFICGALSIFFAALSACTDKGADKDISSIIEAWKTADQNQTNACRAYYQDTLVARKQADTSENFQESYMDFLGTLNALRDYAKKNPSTRVEVRNTLYEIYGKMLYGSDKKEYLEAEGIGAMRKAAGLNDQTLLAELYIVMSELTSDEPLRSAIYDTKAIGLLQKKDREKDYYTPKNYFELADVFFRAEDWRDAIKYGSLYLENIPEDSSGNLLATRLSAMDMVGTSYMEISQWDSCSAMFENMLSVASDSLAEPSDAALIARLKERASGKLGIVQAKWQQFAQAKENLEAYLNSSIKAKDTSDIIYAYLGMGQLQMGTGDGKKAISDLKQARRFATTKRFPLLQTKVYDELAKAFQDTGQEDSASICKRKLQMLQEKIQASRQDVELLKTRTEHELLQIQNDINTVQSEKATKRSWTWLIVVAAVLLASIAVMVAGRKRFRMKIHRRIARQHEQKQKEKASEQLDQMADSLKTKGLVEEDGTPKDLSGEDGWLAFREKFAEVHPDFFANLNKALGRKATPTYEKVAALIFLGLDNKQIGKILGIDKDSVGRTKRRIRTLTGCQTQEDLQDVISRL